MTLDRYRQLALSLRAGHPLAEVDQGLDMLLIWLGNPDNRSVAALDAAIAASGQSRRVAAERAFDMLDRLLFGPTAEPARRLGLPAWIDRETAKRRYRRLVQAYHPDRHPNRARMLTARIEQINLAFAAFNRSRSALLGAEEANTDAEHGGDVGRATPFGFAPPRPASRFDGDPHIGLDGIAAEAEVHRNEPPQREPDPRPRSRLRAGTALGAGRGLSLALAGGLVVLAVLAFQAERRAADPPGAVYAAVEEIGVTAPAMRAVETDTSVGLVSSLDAGAADRIAPASLPEPVVTYPASDSTGEWAALLETAEPAKPVLALSAALQLRTLEPVEAIRLGPGTGAGPGAEVLVEAAPTVDVDVVTGSGSGEVVETVPAAATTHAMAVPQARAERTIAMSTAPRSVLAVEGLANAAPLRIENSAGTPAPRPASAPSGNGVDSTSGRAAPQSTDSCKTAEGTTARFSRAYAAGDLEALMTLYAADARENTSRGRDRIRRIYADWFRETSARRITFRSLSKQTLDHRTCLAEARFSVSYQDMQGRRIDHAGTVTFTFQQRGSEFRIVEADY